MMFGSSDDSYDKDRATNMSAVTVQLGVSARTMDTRESYEQTYNTLCNYDCEGDWVATEEALTSNEKAIKDSRSTGRMTWASSRSSCDTGCSARAGRGRRTPFTTRCLGTSQATSG